MEFALFAFYWGWGKLKFAEVKVDRRVSGPNLRLSDVGRLCVLVLEKIWRIL